MTTNPPLRRRLRIKPGEIWWASGSVQFAALDAAVSAGSAPLSPTMQRTYDDLYSKAQSLLSGPLSERTCLSRDERPFNTRPCLVHQVQDEIAECFVLTTYDGTPMTELPELMQHFSVSVGDTAPWPSPDATVIKPSPDWPKSRETPAYLIAHTIDIPLSCFVAPYKVGDPKVDARAGGQKTHRKRCFVDPEQMMLLELVARQKEQSYKAMNFKDAIIWNDSWEVNARDRMLTSPTTVQEEQIASPSVEQGQVQVEARSTCVANGQTVDELVYLNQENWIPDQVAFNVSYERNDGGIICQPSAPPIPPPPGVALAESMPLHPPCTLPYSPDMTLSPLGPPVHFQSDWGQWVHPHGAPSHEGLPLFPEQVLLVPGRPDDFEVGQYYIDPRSHSTPCGPPLPLAQSWDPAMHQPLSPSHPPSHPPPLQFHPAVPPPPDPSMQHQYISAAPMSPTAVEYFEPQPQYYGPATPHAPCSFQEPTNIQYAHSDYQHNAGAVPGYNQYQAFHPSMLGMHQAEHMYVVTQENASYMPPQMAMRAQNVIMHAPEMVDVAAG